MTDNIECPFCSPSEIVISNEYAYARYDKYPVTEGHLLIIPYRHVNSYFDTTKEEKDAILDLIEQSYEFLEKENKADGYNVGINVGEAAGQTVMHLHVHLIPRFIGDMDDPRGGVRGVIPGRQKY